MGKKFIHHVFIVFLLLGQLSLQGDNSVPVSKRHRYILTSQVVIGFIICISSPFLAWHDVQKINSLKAIVRNKLDAVKTQHTSIVDSEMKQVYRYFDNYFPTSTLLLFSLGFSLLIDGKRQLDNLSYDNGNR